MENLKIKNIIGREEGRISLKNLNNLYPYGVEIQEENNFLNPLNKEESQYDCFLVVLDYNGDIEAVFDTKKEALDSWLSLFNRDLITFL